jgi:hypothetical protein
MADRRPPNYKVDYNNDRIIISGTSVDPPIEVPLLDLKQYKYENQLLPAVSNPNGSYDDWVDFQTRIRVFDMIKDGQVGRKGLGPIPHAATTICNLMYPPSCGVPYTVFGNIVNKIRSDVEQKITKTTWTNPNEKFQNIRKLDTRNTYKESGIGPESVIHNPIYCTNIGTELIDPLKRTYPQNRVKKRFPDIGEKLEITQSFFEFFGFQDCSLVDRRTGDVAHTYQLQIADTIILPSNASQSWYAGNPQKNEYFKQHASDITDTSTKKGLLNVKELASVDESSHHIAPDEFADLILKSKFRELHDAVDHPVFFG